MKENDYKHSLKLFKNEIKALNEQAFVNIDRWHLSGEPLNGVSVEFIEESCARKLLHYVGLKHGLLPLCPNDLVDLEVKEDKIIGSIIRSDFSVLKIKP